MIKFHTILFPVATAFVILTGPAISYDDAKMGKKVLINVAPAMP